METSQGKSIIHDLTEGNVTQQLLLFAYPVIFANLLQTAYTIVDSVIVGRFVSAEALAAVTTSGDIITFLTFLGMGFSMGAQVLISQHVGRKDYKNLSNTIGTLFTTLLVLAILLMVVSLICCRPILRLMNIPEASFQYSVRYFATCAAGMIFIFGYNAVSAILRGLGDSKKPLVFVAIASISNCILDLVFIVVFHWDTLGAALATILGQAISFVASLIYLYKRREAFCFDFRPASFIPQKENLRLLMRLGVPQALQYSAIMLSMLYVTSLINVYGVAAAAVNGAAIKLENICRVVTNSLGTSLTTVVAQCAGAKKYSRCASAVHKTLLICLVYCGICALIIGLFPKTVFSLFSTDSSVLETAVYYAPVGVFVCAGHALRNPYMNIPNAVGNAALSLTVGLLDGVVARIGFSLLFGRTLGMGLVGFWWGSCLAGFVPVIICAPYFYSGKWKKYQLFQNTEHTENT